MNELTWCYRHHEGCLIDLQRDRVGLVGPSFEQLFLFEKVATSPHLLVFALVNELLVSLRSWGLSLS